MEGATPGGGGGGAFLLLMDAAVLDEDLDRWLAIEDALERLIGAGGGGAEGAAVGIEGADSGNAGGGAEGGGR